MEWKRSEVTMFGFSFWLVIRTFLLQRGRTLPLINAQPCPISWAYRVIPVRIDP